MATDEQPDRSLLWALPGTLRSDLLANARPVRIVAGATLFSAGEAGNGCYQVNQGLLKITVKVAENEQIQAMAGPGMVIGELSLLEDGNRSTSVVAVKDSELIFISRTHFKSFAQQHPDVYKHLLPLLVQRLRGIKPGTAETYLLC